MKIKFLDTNILLSHLDAIEKEDKFLLSSVTLSELESIKTSGNKSEDIKYAARKAEHFLDENKDKYEVIVYDINAKCDFLEYGLEDTPDNRIMRCAEYAKDVAGYNDLVFVTNDILCGLIAKNYFRLRVEGITDTTSYEEYKGFVEKTLSDDEMNYFYENLHENEQQNIYDLLVNEYLIIKDKNGDIINCYRWNGTIYQSLSLYKKPIKSLYFDKLKAKDVYQSCAIDSLMNCTVTAISGKAGSGKSLLSLMVAMHLIESGKYDRLVVMFNPTKTRGSSDLGYYSGDFISKAMQNSIGQILTTKFGDRYAIDLLLQQNKLKLVSMADARGMEISDNEILWITESENTSIDLIKLCLSRMSSGAKAFIEGDYECQTDSHLFEGNNNGLKRLINAFKGHEEFGYIQLQNVWRSKIAELCELL